MKTKRNFFFLLSFFLLPLTSCGNQAKVESISVPSIYSGAGDIRVIGSDFVSPFDTSITANLYYRDDDYKADEIKEITTKIQDSLLYYHALSDRHYSYYFEGKDDETITNLKTINDSYGEEKEITLDPYLFDLLKASYQFSLDSDGKFNLFLGTLSDIYETKLSDVKDGKNQNTKAAAMELSTNLYFSELTEKEKEEINRIVATIPHTRKEMEGLLTFDDEKNSVVFHRYQKAGKLAISLGGNAKGFATEYLTDQLKEDYPNISLLINSGFSSIKAIGERPDGKSWKIRYDNPVYFERIAPSKTSYAKAEVKLEKAGEFALSTSAFYQQYFYGLSKGEREFHRYMHILDAGSGYSSSFFDQVSLISDDAFYADMMTTALMNFNDVEDAIAFYDSMNQKYQKEGTLLLCYKADKTGNPYSYSLDDYDSLSSSSLPIAVLKDGTTYEGDYKDLEISKIQEISSKFVPSFQEIYQTKGNDSQNFSLLSEKEIGQKYVKRIGVLKNTEK